MGQKKVSWHSTYTRRAAFVDEIQQTEHPADSREEVVIIFTGALHNYFRCCCHDWSILHRLLSASRILVACCRLPSREHLHVTVRSTGTSVGAACIMACIFLFIPQSMFTRAWFVRICAETNERKTRQVGRDLPLITVAKCGRFQALAICSWCGRRLGSKRDRVWYPRVCRACS